MDLLQFCGCGFVVGHLAGIYLVCFELLGFFLWFIWLVATGCGGGWSWDDATTTVYVFVYWLSFVLIYYFNV